MKPAHWRGSSRNILFIISLAFLNVIAFAQSTIRVPADQPSIQAAIDSAVNGDTVLVSPGTYNERIDFHGKNITVKSLTDAVHTIIDGQNGGPVVSFHNSETNAAVLSGFTLQHGKNGDGGGIYVASSSPIIEHNVITENGCGEGGGIGIEFASPTIRFNIIHHNNRAADCYPSGVGGGGLSIRGAGTAKVLYNEIYENRGGYDGGGIEMWAAGNALIEGNFIHDNLSNSSQGGGLNIDNEGASIVRNNIIVNNHGGGVYWGRMPGDFSNNTVAYNHSTDTYAAELAAFSWWDGSFRNNIIAASPGGIAIRCESSTTYGITAEKFTYNNVFGNSGTAYTCPAQTGANHNISADPLFADPLGEDFHVGIGSPVIEAADPTTPTTMTQDAGGAPRVVGALDLGGYEYQGQTTMAVSPTSLVFGSQKTNNPTAAQSVLVTNTGSKTLHLKPFQLGADFTQSSNCAGPSGVAPAASCTVQVAFSPVSAGAKSETLIASGANVVDQATVGLTGTGTAPVASLSASALDFGDQALFTTSLSKTVTLSNIGDADLVVASSSTTGDFSFLTNCGTLVPNASCQFTVTFTPTATRSRTGALKIIDDAAGSPRQVMLSGNGTGPEIAFSPAVLYFPQQPVNTIGPSQPVSVTNTGTANLVISSMQISTDYIQTNDCPASLSPSSSCTVSISFKPTLYGSRPGTLTVADNAAASPQAVQLSGAGSAPIASFFPTSWAFGPTLVNTVGSSVGVLYRNIGNDFLYVTSITATGDFSQTNNCDNYISPYLYCVINITFTPTQAGTRTGSIIVSDNAAGSPRTISLTGQAIAAYPTPTVTSVSPQSVKVGSSNATVTVSGTGFFPTSIIYWDGQPLATTFLNSTALSATPGTSLISGYGDHAITVVNPAPGGGTSNAVNVTTFISLPLSTRELVYDPFRRVFYASIAGAATTAPNTIVTIDPLTGQTGTPIPIGNEPHRLAISDDGQFLWIGIDGAHSIKRLNLYTNQVDLEIPLGNSWAIDLKAVPGSPHSVAVVLSPEEGIKIYDDGVARPTWGGGSYISWITFGADASILYGSQGSVSPPSLIRMKVDDAGVTYLSDRWNSGGAEIKYLGNRLYSYNRVYDAANFTDVGLFAFTTGWVSSVYPEPGTGRIYLIENNFGSGVNIWAGDTATLSSAGKVVLQVPTDRVEYLQRWGVDGLAFRNYSGSTNLGGAGPNDQVVLVRTNITNPSSSNNPTPIVSSLQPSLVGVGAPNFLLTVVGSNFAAGAVVRWNGADRTTTFISATQLRVAIPATDLAVEGTATIVVLNPTPAGGLSNEVPFDIANTLEFSVSQLQFGDQAKGKASSAKSVTLINKSSTPVAISQISTTGDFSETTTCNATIGSGASCSVAVSFRPTAEGLRNGTLRIVSDAIGSPHVLPLTGNGLAGSVQVSATSLDFGSAVVGSSVTKDVTVTNNGPADVAISSITASGAFSQTNNCTTLIAGASCTINAKFSPANAGNASGSINIVHDGSGGQSVVQLTAIGTDFSLAAGSGNTTSATVSAGHSAVYNLNVSGSAGFAGSLSFTCSGAPSQSSCTVTPNTVTVQSGVPANITVTVATAGSTAGFQGAPTGSGVLPPVPLTVSLLLACLAITLSLSKGGRPRRVLVFVQIAVLFVMVGCGGGGGGGTSTPPPTPRTPAGTYNITVNATSGAATRTLNLTLIVQ